MTPDIRGSETLRLFGMASEAPFFREFLWNMSHDFRDILDGEGTEDEKKTKMCEAFIRRYSYINEEMMLTVKYKFGRDAGKHKIVVEAYEDLVALRKKKLEMRKKDE